MRKHAGLANKIATELKAQLQDMVVEREYDPDNPQMIVVSLSVEAASVLDRIICAQVPASAIEEVD